VTIICCSKKKHGANNELGKSENESIRKIGDTKSAKRGKGREVI